jgi:hypothetical protein
VSEHTHYFTFACTNVLYTLFYHSIIHDLFTQVRIQCDSVGIRDEQITEEANTVIAMARLGVEVKSFDDSILFEYSNVPTGHTQLPTLLKQWQIRQCHFHKSWSSC